MKKGIIENSIGVLGTALALCFFGGCIYLLMLKPHLIESHKYHDPRVYIKEQDEDNPGDSDIIFDNDSVYVFIKKLDTVYSIKSLKNEK